MSLLILLHVKFRPAPTQDDPDGPFLHNPACPIRHLQRQRRRTFRRCHGNSETRYSRWRTPYGRFLPDPRNEIAIPIIDSQYVEPFNGMRKYNRIMCIRDLPMNDFPEIILHCFDEGSPTARNVQPQ
jgi:hypothetical protein